MSRLRPSICIVLPDPAGATLRLGQALADRLANVTLGRVADPSATINYFLDPAMRTQKGTTLEMGWFAHLPQTQTQDDAPHYRLAREMDQVVTPTQALCDRLTAAGVADAIAIPPGATAARHQGRKLRIGVLQAPSKPDSPAVAMLTALQDSAQVTLVFAAPGWPGPLDPVPRHALAASSAAFFATLDAVLVPEASAETALSLAEALALGLPIIAPEGCQEIIAGEYVSFDSADAHSLPSVLTARIAARDISDPKGAAVPDWDACAQAHQELFQSVADRAQTRLRGAGPANAPKPPFDRPVRLLLHGEEDKALGGPTVRVPRTATALRALGVPAQARMFDGQAGSIDEDVVHLFNVWPPASALDALHSLKSAGKTVIFSPIYLDFSERGFWQTDLPRMADADPAHLAERRTAFRAHAKVRGRLPEIVPGYHAMLREMLDLADHVIFLSTAERSALERIGVQVDPARSSLIPNPVDTDAWADGDPALFRETYLDGLPGPKDYVICVGRIEERKNQLMLARAMRDLPVRLVLLGHPGSPDYAAQVRRAAGPDVLIPGRIAPGSEMLRSALTGARAFALPSWAEGASLAALEAAACGTGLVLSAQSSERAYFGDLAQYCDPADPLSIRAAVEQALQCGDEAARRTALQAHMRAHNNWPQHAADTAAAYAKAVQAPGAAGGMPVQAGPVQAGPVRAGPVRAGQHLTIDITPSGDARTSARVAVGLAQALCAQGTPPRLIFWHPALQDFTEVPARFRDMDQALRYCRGLGAGDDRGDPATPVTFAPGTALVTLGDVWRHNDAYLNALEDLKMRADCSLLALVQDLAPLEAPYLYPAPAVAMLRAGLRHLAALADGIFVTSQPIADVLAQALSAPTVPIMLLPAAANGPDTSPKMPDGPVQARFSNSRFVLATGDVDPQSNHEMLCRIWADLGRAAGSEDLKLVIACPSGAASAALADRIARDAQIADRVHMVTDPGGADLSWLYTACRFTLLPTQRNDAALPLWESLAHGRLCLTSPALSLAPELADLACQIAPDDAARWTDCIAAYAAATPEVPKAHTAQITAGQAPQSYTAAARVLAEAALAPRALRRFRKTYLGQTLAVGAGAPPLSIRFGPGWHQADAALRWASSTTASLTLKDPRAERDTGKRLHVLLRLRAHIPEGVTLPFRITCGDLTVFEDRVDAVTFPGEVLVSMPTTALDPQGECSLQLHLPPSLMLPEDTDANTGANTGANTDENTGGTRAQGRLIGTGLISATLLDPERSNPLLHLSAPHHWSAGDITLTADMSDPAHRGVVAPGRDYSPAWGVGAGCGRLDLRIPVLPGAGAHMLQLTVRPVASARHPVTASLFWNGRKLAERTWHDDMPDTLSLPLTQADMDICGPCILSVQGGSLLTPADLAIGTSTRHAGLGVTDIVLIPEASPHG